MKKLTIAAVAAFALATGSASAADLVTKAKPIVAPEPPAWDLAFGSAIASDYVFRGVTQSNHKPSVAAYFEPRYNITKDNQLYVGLSGESISFANRAAAEIDVYGGIRPTFGAFAFDIGVWGYLYPGGTCQFGTGLAPGVDFAGHFQGTECATNFLPNGHTMKKDVSFFEVYGTGNYTVHAHWPSGV